MNQFMAGSPSFRQMVEERYLSPSYNPEELAKCQPGTLGYAYYRHMHDNNFTPDWFSAVKPVDDWNYSKLRVLQTHDIWHVLTGHNTSMVGEMGLHAFYNAQMPAAWHTMILATGFLHTVIAGQTQNVPLIEAVKRGWENGRAARPYTPFTGRKCGSGLCKKYAMRTTFARPLPFTTLTRPNRAI